MSPTTPPRVHHPGRVPKFRRYAPGTDDARRETPLRTERVARSTSCWISSSAPLCSSMHLMARWLAQVHQLGSSRVGCLWVDTPSVSYRIDQSWCVGPFRRKSADYYCTLPLSAYLQVQELAKYTRQKQYRVGFTHSISPSNILVDEATSL